MANTVSIYICDLAEFKKYMDLEQIPLEDVHEQGDDEHFPALEEAIEFAAMDLEEHEQEFLGWIHALLTGLDERYIQLEDDEVGSVTAAMFPNTVAGLTRKADQCDLRVLADKIQPAMLQDFPQLDALVAYLDAYRKLLRRAKEERAGIAAMIWV